jgi:hypothetical protein
MINYDRVVEVYDSENIGTVSYSVTDKIMKVRFSNETEYIYHNVTLTIFGSIVSGENVGKMFYSLVSSNPETFPYEKVDI